MIAPPILKSPRELLRTHYRELLEQKSQELSSGPLEGVRVVLMEDINWILGEPFPPASENGAEVATPARVVVWAICPRCGLAGSLAVELTPELRVDSHGGSLHLKAKSKPVSHACGQLTIAGSADGQESFELEDIIGDESRALELGDIVRVVDVAAGYLVGPVVRYETDAEVIEADGGMTAVQDRGDRQVVVANPHDSNQVVYAFPADADRVTLGEENAWRRCDFPFCPLAVEHKGDHMPIKPIVEEDGEVPDEAPDANPLDVDDKVEGQPAACEFPSCTLPAGHDGPHDQAPWEDNPAVDTKNI